MNKRLLIIYEDEEWEWFDGTPSEAIAHIKADRRWCNYGRKGAKLVAATILYEISMKQVERYIEELTRIDDLIKTDDEMRHLRIDD